MDPCKKPQTTNITSAVQYTNLTQTSSMCDEPDYANVTLSVPLTAVGQLIMKLDLYFVPVIILVGLLGNTISFIVFVSTSLRSLSSSVYLAALSVADSGFLLCVLVMWSHNINWNLHHQPGWCQLFVYLTYFFSFLSVWYVVAFTVERFIAVCFPFKRSTMCTVTRARVVVTVMAVLSGIMYNFALWTTEVVPRGGIHVCEPRNSSFELVQVINNIDTVITLIIPMIIIIILNVKISQKMIAFHSEMKKIIRNHSNARRGTVIGGSTHQVTKMLLVVSTVFLVLNLPSHAIRVHHFLMGFSQSYIPNQTYIDCQTLFQYIYYLNFATNFFLYSLVGKNFRHALKQLCCQRMIKSVRVFCSRLVPGSTTASGRASPITNETFQYNDAETFHLRMVVSHHKDLD